MIAPLARYLDFVRRQPIDGIELTTIWAGSVLCAVLLAVWRFGL